MGTTIMSEELKQKIGVGDAGPPRAIYLHAIPTEYIPYSDGVTHLGFVKLTIDEELAAYDRSQGNSTKAGIELVTESLRAYKNGNGSVQKVQTFDGSADRLVRRLDPLIRNFAAGCYNRHHQPSKEVSAPFIERFEIIA
jgi:hypothetical protein